MFRPTPDAASYVDWVLPALQEPFFFGVHDDRPKRVVLVEGPDDTETQIAFYDENVNPITTAQAMRVARTIYCTNQLSAAAPLSGRLLLEVDAVDVRVVPGQTPDTFAAPYYLTLFLRDGKYEIRDKDSLLACPVRFAAADDHEHKIAYFDTTNGRCES